MLLIYNKCLRRIKFNYFYRYYLIVIKLVVEEIQSYKIIKNRYNKLFNDYKTKQIMLNELQKRYLSKEGKKYTFYPIINNYIIRYNRQNFPNFGNTEIYYQEDPSTHKYYDGLNSKNNCKKTKDFDYIPQDINSQYNYIIKYNNKNKKISIQKKNGCLISNRNKNNNNIYKNSIYTKTDNYNIQNINKYSFYDHKTNIFPKKIKLANVISPNIKASKIRENLSESNKVIQKTNSIKTLFSNYSNVYKDSNINKLNFKNKKDINNNIKIIIPLEELKNFNYSKKTYVNTNHSSYKYLTKSNEFKNNYNKTNYSEGISLKNLIIDEKAKNNSKPKKGKNISKEKLNKTIDSLLNKKYKNCLKLNIDEGRDFNENQNNIRIKSNNFINVDENHRIFNKKLKTENIHRKFDINIKYNRINIEKSLKNGSNINQNTRSINLTEQQSRQNRKYYNNNTYNKKCITSIGQKDYLTTLKHISTANKGYDYSLNLNYNNILPNKKNTLSKRIINNKAFKEKIIPIPKPSYYKISILNKMSEAKRGMQNILMNETNSGMNINNKHIYNKMIDFNQTNNDETNQTEMVSKENIINIMNNTISNNTQSIDADKNIFSMLEKKYDNRNYNRTNNKVLINRKNKIQKGQIKKIDSFKFDGEKNENKIEIKNNFKITNQDINEYYSEIKEIKEKKENNLDEKEDLSMQSLSDSKVLEIANTYVDEQVDKTQVSDILTYKRKQNQFAC